MFYTRKILPKLLKELSKREVVVLTGMRQVGKTTILEYLFGKVESKNKVLFDLEDPLKRKIFEEESFDNIWENLKSFGIKKEEKAYIFLDEIQNLPIIPKVVKYFYDHNDVKFILTGSASFYLKNLFSESLSSRKVVYELYPLDFEEFLNFKGLSKTVFTSFKNKVESKNKVSFELYIKYYKEFMEYGGFPAVVLEGDRERKIKLQESIFTSYFEKDIKNLGDFGEVSKLRDLILLLVPRVGSKIEISKISSELSVSRETVYNYLSFLEGTYFIGMLGKFSKSFDRKAAGNKKLYLTDTGIANYLGRISEGALFENSVYQVLKPWHKLSYYSKKHGNEIDFIVDEKVALEIKLNPTRRDGYNLKRRMGSVGLGEGYVVSQNYNNDKNVIVCTDL